MLKQRILTIALLRKHLKEHQYLTLKNGVVLDVQSINKLCMIYDSLKTVNKRRFTRILKENPDWILSKIWVV